MCENNEDEAKETRYYDFVPMKLSLTCLYSLQLPKHDSGYPRIQTWAREIEAPAYEYLTCTEYNSCTSWRKDHNVTT